MSTDIRQFSTRKQFDDEVWSDFVCHLSYRPGTFADAKTFERIAALVKQLDGEWQTDGNVLYYLAVPPPLFAVISAQVARAGGTAAERGWRRVIVEKPFGHDLASAIGLSRELLKHWREATAQIWEIHQMRIPRSLAEGLAIEDRRARARWWLDRINPWRRADMGTTPTAVVRGAVRGIRRWIVYAGSAGRALLVARRRRGLSRAAVAQAVRLHRDRERLRRLMAKRHS